MSDILLERSGAVNILRFNRLDKKNAITGPMYRALADGLSAGEADDAIRVHLVLGSPGAFCAGNDIGDFLGAARSGALGSDVIDFLKTLARLDKPLIAGVDGLAVGVGTTLLFHCDMVLASERTLLKTPFVDLGLVPEAASSLLGPLLIGHQRAFQLLVAGEAMKAQEALACGIINRIVDVSALEAESFQLAERLAAKPANAMKTARRLLKGDPAPVLARIDAEAEAFKTALRSPEAQASFAAFLARK